MSFFTFSTRHLGIDLGTNSILVAMKEKGIIIDEPAIIAMDKKTGKLLATGDEAKTMLGREPDKITVIRPLQGGVIADLKATVLMLKDVFSRINKKHGFARTKVVLGVPVGITEVEKRAAQEAVCEAGAREVFLIDEPLAAAIGANIDIGEPNGTLIVDIGSGTTEVAVISLGGIVVSSSTRIAGDEIDKNIKEYVSKNLGLEISEVCAENIKKNIATTKNIVKETMEVKGRDLLTGFPKTIEITSEQVLDAISNSISKIISEIKMIIEKTPPELIEDIMARGIILTGGMSNIKGLDETISEGTGIKVCIAENPFECTVRGAQMTLENVDIMRLLRIKRRR